MPYDFTTPPQRLETDSQKWQKYAGRDILPMWVADMDFESSPAILEALHQRVDHGVFGYARPVQSTLDAVVKHHREHYGWEVDPSWFVWLPGMVCGLNLSALAFCEPGDTYLTLSPVYPPFFTAGRNFDRRSLRVAWTQTATGWEIDWEALAAAVTPQTKLFYLCNPHNPIGRVWRRAELERLGAFCLEHDLLLISDEIHCDLILDDRLPHIPSALISPELAERTITLMAPSKTYNIAGLGCTLAIISNESLRRRFHQLSLGLLPEVNNLAYAACEAAYDGSSEAWRQDLLTLLRSNMALIEKTIAELPGVRLTGPQEATYLAWIDVSELQLPNASEYFESHGIGLSDGVPFGAQPNTHVRLNFGCPEVTLQEGLRRFATAVQACRN